MNDIILRDYQQKGVQEIRGEYAKGKKAPIYVLPTGGGKTFTFSYVAAKALEKDNYTLILVHRKELLFQASKSLKAMGLKHGLIKSGISMNPDAKIQVASKDTLIHRMTRLQWLKPDLIIIDEAHHATAGTWRKILDFYKEAWLLGVTATPCRLDGKGLGLLSGGVFDSMVLGPTMRNLINNDYLCDFDIYAPPIPLDLSQVKTRAGDFAKDQLAAAMDKPSITGHVIEHYKAYADRKPSIAFCVSVAHAEHVANQFRLSGYTAKAISGKTPDKERDQAIRDLGEGRLNVLCSCDIISEGTDVPIVECAILLRPTKSLSLFLQQVGRVLRPGKNKRAIILDHVGNVTKRHGFPDEDQNWTLEGKKKRKRKQLEEVELKVRMCSQCFKVHKPSPTCPHCLYEYPIEVRKLEEKAGNLKKLTKEDRERIKNQKRQEQNQAQTLVQLIDLGKKRGYKNPSFWARKVLASRKAKRYR